MKLSIAASLVAILLLAITTLGQSDRGAIRGLIVDQQDQVIPDATVTLTNKATGARTEVTTDGSGSFLFPALVVGSYEVIAERTGFKRFIQSEIQVDVGRTSALTLTLSPGEVTETVTITDEASATLDTATSDTGTSVSRRQILDLPVPLTGSMRNPLNFVILTPGVSGSVPGANPDLRLHISGTPSASAEVYVDGVPIADTNSSGAIGSNHPSLEAVGEFKISNNSYSAEYGLASGIISFTLRSGTNDFHGNVFEFHQNDKLNAFDFVTKATAGFNRTEPVKAPLKQNEYGFSLGGPVYLPRFGEGGRAFYSGHDRTFFFTSYTGFKFRPSANSFNLTTFPNRFRQGDFSQLLGTQVTVPNPLNAAERLPLFDPAGRPVIAGAIYDPTQVRTVTGPDGRSYQIRDPLAGNIIPAGYAGLSAAARRILQDFPQAQTDALFNNFSRQLRSTTDQERFVAKIDHNLSSRQTLAVSVSLASNLTANIGTLNDLNAGQNDSPGLQTRIAHNFTISPRLINSFSFGFLRDRFTNGPVVPTPPLSSLGLRGISLPDGSPYPGIGIRNQNGIGGGGFSFAVQNRFLANDTVTYVRGNHTLKIGGEFRRLQRNEGSNNAGSFAFEPTQTALNGVGFVNTAQGPRAVSVPSGATGSSAASFLFGAVDFSRFDLGATTAGYRWLTASGFVQDDWKATRNLTLNLGLRYDLSIPRTEVLGRVSTVDRTLPNPRAGGLPGAYTFFGEGPGRNGRKRIGDIDWTAFQPRVGLAYTPDVEGGFLGALLGKERTVIRTSFAITRPLGNDNLTNGISGGLYAAGFNGVATANRPGDALGSPAFFLDQPFPGFTPPPTIDPGLLSGNANPALLDSEVGRLPTQINWAFEVQRQLPGDFLASVGYVGTHIYHLGIWRKPNQVPREAAERFRGAATAAGLPLNEFLNLNIADPRVMMNAGDLSPFPTFRQLFGPSATVAQALRPFPQYGNIDNLMQPVGSTSYNGMLTKLQKRFSGGLTMLLSYTFSKTLGDVDSFQGAAAGAENALFARSFQQDFYDNRSERSVTSSDIPHVLALSYTYELPIGPGKPLLNQGGVVGKLVGGWQVSAIHLYQSGRPLFLEYQAFGAGNPLRAQDGFSFRPNRVTGVPVVNPAYDRSCSGPLLGSGRQPCQFYINPAAFVAPPAGEFGNAPKFFDDLRAQPYFNEDISITKRTPLGERFVLLLQANAFNAFNRVVLGTGGSATTIFNLAPRDLNTATLVGSGTPFGILTTQQNGPRRIQLGVKLELSRS
ncbi:MAG: TonB-dependent receptor [Acidobacteria bacterium]|nr:TonB-dependent receptor [Acidobacteriota bacterium]